MKTIDLTPTWSGLLRPLVDLTRSVNGEARKTAWEELERMAKAADLYNASLKGEK